MAGLPAGLVAVSSARSFWAACSADAFRSFRSWQDAVFQGSVEPFGILVDDSFEKDYVEGWVFHIADTSDLTLPEDQGDLFPETPRVTFPVPSSHREAPKPEISASTQQHNEALLPPSPSRPTCERLELLFSDDDVLSGFEDITYFAPISLPRGVQDS